jgi:2-oxoisovalerate dehydrogenase E2 component (dihydrolipoyl transacylase)
MGRYLFKLPDVGEGTVEAEIVAWHVKVGDEVQEDQNLVDVMTDKATVEMTSPVSGKIVALIGELGDMAAVGSPLVELEVQGAGNVKANGGPAAAATEKPKSAPPEKAPARTEAKPAKPEPAPEPARRAEPKLEPTSVQPNFAARAEGDKPLASPAVRRRAHELGIALQFVRGSGRAGRISHQDLDDYIATGGKSPSGQNARGGRTSGTKRDGVEDIKVIGLRRKIAQRMQESKRHIPHFAYVDEIDMTALEELRAHLNAAKHADQPRLSVLPFLMLALTRALPEFPQINAHFDDEAGVVHRHAAVHVGIATQTANGLIVPVVRHAEARDIWDNASEVARVAALARDNKASTEDLTGSTITITSLGALGGVATTPIINYPEVAIIGPNAILERPVVRDGIVVVRKMMNLSSSFDHRVVDGYDAARFVQRLKALLEHPATLFM